MRVSGAQRNHCHLKRLAVLGAALVMSSCQPPQRVPAAEEGTTSEPEPAPQARADGRPPISEGRTVDVPDTGIELGWGWDSINDRPVPAFCIEFLPAEELGQTKQVSVHEVSDSFETMNRLGVSASASVSAMGFSGSAKAEFAKEVKVNGFSSTYVINAAVSNGVRFAAPVSEDSRIREQVAAGRSEGQTYPFPEGALRLTPQARRAAADFSDFTERCGDSYVSAIYSGATLYAAITFETSSQAEQEEISVEMSGGGWGVEVSAGLDQKTESTVSNTKKTVVVHQTGGRGDKIAIDVGGLQSKLGELAQLAADEPKLSRMTVMPYSKLPEWPGTETPQDRIDEYIELASYWGSYTTLYDEIAVMLESPQGFLLGNVHTYESLQGLQDRVQDGVAKMEALAASCATEDPNSRADECSFEAQGFDDPNALRIQLPLPRGAYADGDVDQKTELRELWRLSGPSEEDELPSIDALETKLETPAVLLADSEAVLLQVLVADYYVRDSAARRCELSRTAYGCLSNREVFNWQNCVPTTLAQIQRLASPGGPVLESEGCGQAITAP